jgi:hypothetical protein
MLLAAPASYAEAIAALQKAGKLPRGLSAQQIALLQKSLQKYAGEVGQRVIDKIFADYNSKIQTAQSQVAPEQMRGVIADLTRAVGSEGIADQIKFSLHVAQEVSSGAGRFLNQNLSPEVLDEYPALELKRMFNRSLPRGLKREGKTVVEVPEDAWDTDNGRWQEALDACADDDDQKAAMQDAFDAGRMVALKSSDIWNQLGNLRDDALGNPFPPFAFNSGYMTYVVSRADAVELGLIGEAEEAKPARFDLGKLFAEVAA